MRIPGFLYAAAVASAVLLATSTAHAQSFVGKKASVQATAEHAIPAGCTVAPYAQATLPTAYKSKKNFLFVTTSVQQRCLDGQLSSLVEVDGHPLQPPNDSITYVECADSSIQWSTREWVLVPESLGGPAIPDGATVDFHVCRVAGTESVGNSLIEVRIDK